MICGVLASWGATLHAQDAAPTDSDSALESGEAPESLDEGPDEEMTDIPDVVVTGTRLERDVETAPVRTQVVDRAQIEQRNARNLAEAVTYTSGVRVETNCQNCGFTQLRLNGLDGAYTQVLIDGLPTFSGLAGVYGLEQLPSEMIERIEVVKGGGSALYGPSAVAGVVNLITRMPTASFASVLVNHEQVGLTAPDLRLSADGAVLGPMGNVAVHFFATTRTRDALDLNDDGFTDQTKLRQVAAGANLYFSPTDQSELRLSFHTLQEFRRGGDRLDLPPHEADIAEELQTRRLQGEVRWRQSVTEQWRYSFGYALALTDRNSYYGAGGASADPQLPSDPGQPLDEDFIDDFEAERLALGGYGETLNRLHVGDLHTDFSVDALGPQVLTLGAQFNLDEIEDRYLGYDRVIDNTFTVVGAYLQHDWLFADWGESVVGARIDQHSALKDPIVSPRVALMLRPATWLRLRSAFSTGFRAPQPFDEDLHIETVGGSPRLITNDANLKPERSMSLSQQVVTQIELQQGQSLTLSANGYTTRLRDAFVINEEDDPSTPEEELVRSNRGTTTLLGVELEASLQARRWALRAGWTLERATNQAPDEDFGRRRIFRTPRHYGYLDGVLQLGALQAQSGVVFTGPMLTPRYDANGDPLEVNTSPWFADWSANLTWSAVARDELIVEPFIGVRNILDARQRDLDRGADRDASYVYGPAQPRTVFAGLRGFL